VTLRVDGVDCVTRQYTESLVDGDVGLGTSDAVAHFDDVAVNQYETSAVTAMTSDAAATVVEEEDSAGIAKPPKNIPRHAAGLPRTGFSDDPFRARSQKADRAHPDWAVLLDEVLAESTSYPMDDVPG